MRTLPRIPSAVARKLGHYVYLYVNPLDRSIFYVGKGKGARAVAHLDDAEKRKVARRIRTIRAAGAEPEIEILVHGLRSAEVALQVEAAVINALGISGLANAVRGWRGAKLGRAPLNEVVARYTRRRASIKEPAMVIRINRLYRYGMSDLELYDATRSAWVLGPRRERAEYALAGVRGGGARGLPNNAMATGGLNFQCPSARKSVSAKQSLGVRRCPRPGRFARPLH